MTPARLIISELNSALNLTELASSFFVHCNYYSKGKGGGDVVSCVSHVICVHMYVI